MLRLEPFESCLSKFESLSVQVRVAFVDCCCFMSLMFPVSGLEIFQTEVAQPNTLVYIGEFVF